MVSHHLRALWLVLVCLVIATAVSERGAAQTECSDQVTIGNYSSQYNPPPKTGGWHFSGPPAGWDVKNEAGIELTAAISPTKGAVKDRHEVVLQNGQLEFTLPLGIGGKGRNGHDLYVELKFQSGINNGGSIAGQYWSLNIVDFFFGEISMPLGRECEGSGATKTFSVRDVINSIPYLSRVKGGRLETWTNYDAAQRIHVSAG